MGNLCAKLVIVAGVVLLPITLMRNVATVWQFLEMLRHGSTPWVYYVWMPTGVVREWTIAVALILIGVCLLRTDKWHSVTSLPLPPPTSDV
jgi:hypothetical protein